MSTKFIPMTELGVPSTLTLSNLTDVNHPVNSKSLSGKREGMCVMVGGTLYIAEGSSPSDKWIEIQAGALTKSKHAIYNLKSNSMATQVTNNISNFVQVSASSLKEVAPKYKEGIVVNDKTYSFTFMEDGDYVIEATGIAYTTDGSANIGSHLYFHLIVLDTAEVLSGSENVTSFGINFGSTATLSFHSLGYGSFKKGQTVRLSVAADFDGLVFIDDSILSVKEL